MAGSSGRNSPARPVRTTNHSACEGTSTIMILSSSSRIRSADTMESRPCMRSHRGDQRRVGHEVEKRATNRAARNIRSGSSVKETSGSSGVRRRPAARSASPPKGSISSMSARRRAMAFTVKSRRDRSTSMSSPKLTSGFRDSGT